MSEEETPGSKSEIGRKFGLFEKPFFPPRFSTFCDEFPYPTRNGKVAGKGREVATTTKARFETLITKPGPEKRGKKSGATKKTGSRKKKEGNRKGKKKEKGERRKAGEGEGFGGLKF